MLLENISLNFILVVLLEGKLARGGKIGRKRLFEDGRLKFLISSVVPLLHLCCDSMRRKVAG